MGGYNVVPSAIQRRIMGLGVPEEEDQSYEMNYPVPDPDSEEAVMSVRRPSDSLIGQHSSVEPQGSVVSPNYGPEERNYLEQLHRMPQKNEFPKPTKTRKGLGIAAGVGTAILGGGIRGGIEEGKAVMEEPYRSALSDYYRNLEENKAAAGVETGGRKLAAEEGEKLANREAAKERAAMYRVSAERFGRMYTPEYWAEQEKLAQIRRAGQPKQFQVVPPGSSVLNQEGKEIFTAKPRPGNTTLDQSMRAHKVLLEEENSPGTQDPAEVAAAKQFVEDKVRNLPAYADIVKTKEKELGRPLKSWEKSAITLPETAQRPPQVLMVPQGGGPAKVIKPGENVAPDMVTPQQAGQEVLGTSTTRTMKETAPKVIELANVVLKQIDEQEKTLGPGASRWNELMAGKIGAPNPEFTKLRTNTALLQTLLMRMHVGAAGRVAMMEQFKDLFDVGKQSAPNMRAAVNEIKNYAQGTLGGKVEDHSDFSTAPKATKRYNPTTGKIEEIK